MKNVLLNICFVGTNYHGFQVQKNANTIQNELQNALRHITYEPFFIKGCSRTDSGVHANNYALNFKTFLNIEAEKFAFILNNFLPDDIVVKRSIQVPLDFHARYDCVAKEYIYKINNSKFKDPFLKRRVMNYHYPLNVEIINEAALFFVGEHDFSAFCNKDLRENKNMVRNIELCKATQKDNIVEISVKADGFLYNMVRIIVGTLIRVAQGKLEPEDIKNIISSKKRDLAGPTAISDGLYLNKVFYDALEFCD